MAILNGMVIWNNFLWPLLVLRSAEKFTLPIGLNTLLTPYGNNYDAADHRRRSSPCSPSSCSSSPSSGSSSPG